VVVEWVQEQCFFLTVDPRGLRVLLTDLVLHESDGLEDHVAQLLVVKDLVAE
jgi:hypothetical protein